MQVPLNGMVYLIYIYAKFILTLIPNNINCKSTTKSNNTILHWKKAYPDIYLWPNIFETNLYSSA
jgi:hypothetical protein